MSNAAQYFNFDVSPELSGSASLIDAAPIRVYMQLGPESYLENGPIDRKKAALFGVHAPIKWYAAATIPSFLC